MATKARDEDSKKGNLKNAASILLKGGSLIDRQCSMCGGVQVEHKGQILCVNCGVSHLAQPQVIEAKIDSASTHGDIKIDRNAPSEIIQLKIIDLINHLQAEQDQSILQIRVQILDTLLDVLDKTRRLVR